MKCSANDQVVVSTRVKGAEALPWQKLLVVHYNWSYVMFSDLRSKCFCFIIFFFFPPSSPHISAHSNCFPFLFPLSDLFTFLPLVSSRLHQNAIYSEITNLMLLFFSFFFFTFQNKCCHQITIYWVVTLHELADGADWVMWLLTTPRLHVSTHQLMAVTFSNKKLELSLNEKCLIVYWLPDWGLCSNLWAQTMFMIIITIKEVGMVHQHRSCNFLFL